MAAGLGPLGGGWRLLGRETENIRSDFSTGLPGLCFEDEKASWLELLSLEVKDVGVTTHIVSAGLPGRYQA